MFAGRTVLIATKHNKETVIGPILFDKLGLKSTVPKQFDTDQWGTFSGEIKRKEDALTTARLKCLSAMEMEGVDLGLASEGSFGPHPYCGFIPANDELLVFIDKRNNLEVVARELSTVTNHNSCEVNTVSELLAFAEKVLFPSHALILKKISGSFTHIEKDIVNKTDLIDRFMRLNANQNGVLVETDMRAMHNPTRMQVIKKATLNLVEKLGSVCPQCQMPGYEVSEVVKGLPCQNCQFPTQSALMHVYTCKHCQHQSEKKYPNNKHLENPMYCDLCNP